MSSQEKDGILAPFLHVTNYASIDIGSHTIRLLIARLNDYREAIPFKVERRVTRLARGFQTGNTLKKAGIEVSLMALKEYSDLLRLHKVQSLACGATGVIRRANNREGFFKTIHDETGIRCSVISEESEAELSTKGALSVIPAGMACVLCFDLGGSSTEFTFTEAQAAQCAWKTSVFTGAATVTERFLSEEDPPKPASVDQARTAIRKELESVLASIGRLADDSHDLPCMLVGTAGTVTTLAAMNLKMAVYEPYRVNGLTLTRSWIEDTIDLLARIPVAARKEIPGLEKGREDIILGGAIIVHEIMNGLKIDQLTVTDSGLLEGLLLDLIERETGCSHTVLTTLDMARATS